MRTTLKTIFAIAACAASTLAIAAEYKVGTIEVVAPWSRATPKGASTAIGYMTIKNDGAASDRLIGGSIAVANSFQLHSMVMENGVAKMRELKDCEIKPGQTVQFTPGGSHIMFVGVKRALVKGEHVKGTLVFQHAGTVHIEYDVAGLGARMAPMTMNGMHH